MKTELTQVTPKMARDWLQQNTSNRDLRPNVVDRFMSGYLRGEWKVTHQGIAFGKSGVLLDGQHRLTFISQLPEGTKVPINVTTGQDDSTFDAIDQGVVRTTSDVYGVSAGHTATARFLAKIYNSSTSAGLTNQFVKPFLDWVRPEFEELLTFCPASVRIWSSAPVRAAAIVQIKRGYDLDFIKIAYHSLVHADIESMPYAARALMQQHMTGKIASARSLDLFCRSLRVFDSSQNRKISSILIKDSAVILSDVRAWIAKELKKDPAKAGSKGANPANNFNWKKTA